MKIFKLLIAALFVLALIVPASVSAELRTVGYVMAGLGQYSVDDGTDTTSQLRGESQGQVEFRGSNGNVSYRYRLRVREDTRDSTTTVSTYGVLNAAGVPTGDTVDVSDTRSTGFAAVRHSVAWKVSDQLTLDFWGQAFGLAASFTAYGVYTLGHFGDGMAIGDSLPTTVAFFVNATGVNIDFDLGGMNVGLVILDSCRPGCGASSEEMTLVPHFRGKFGDISVGFFMANATGKDSLDEAVDQSETNIEVAFKTSAIKVGFEYVTTSGSAEVDGTGMALGVQVMDGAVGFHYISYVSEDDAGDVSDDTEIAAVYVHKINDKSSLAFGYAAVTDNFSDPATGATLLIASLKSSF